jgi:D-alanine-D-alanine ligase
VASTVHFPPAPTPETLGLRDLTRVDVIVDRAGDPWILEVNVSPGMTETSLLPMAGHAAGMSLATVCDAVLQSIRQRHPRSDQ